MYEMFNCPIQVLLKDNNEVIVVGYMNYGYETILIDELNNTLEIDELIKPHQCFIINGIKDGKL